MALGRPFAITFFMILVIIGMNVFSEKRIELSQTIASLTGSIRMEKGCQPNSQIYILKEEYHEIEH